jgi:imidazoleglycerol-phosphate dehydratase
MLDRTATVHRETRETKIRVSLNLDGSGRSQLDTGIGFLDHMLDHIARHGLFDLDIAAQGDLHVDSHHTVEDIGICLGRAFDQALGERRGIVRMGSATVPMDEALALAVVDISGRPYAALDIRFTGEKLGDLPTEMISHFLQSFAFSSGMTLHLRLLAGENDHHRAEAIFKALARALLAATRIEPRLAGEAPSTKGMVERA